MVKSINEAATRGELVGLAMKTLELSQATLSCIVADKEELVGKLAVYGEKQREMFDFINGVIHGE